MGVPDYVLDPDGDVIITLRNFDGPFPPLPFEEELNPCGTSGNITWWSSLDDDAQLSAKRKKDKKKKRPRRLNEERIVEIQPVAQNSSTVHEVQPEQDPEPDPEVPAADATEVIEVIDATNVAFPFPEEVVESEKEDCTPPPEPCVLFQVSSAHLRLGSRYFKNALNGPFKESQPGTDGFRHIDAEGFDTYAFLTVMRILHGQNREVPRNVKLEMLAKVATVVDYYECDEVLEPFTEIWYPQFGGLPAPETVDKNLIMLLFVSWVFKWSEVFKTATKIARNQSKGPLSTMGLPIPDRIISVIDHQRRDTLHAISNALKSLLDRFRQEQPHCSEACSSMSLGSLERQLMYQKGLQFHPSSSRSLAGYSVAFAIKAVQGLKTPSWRDGSYLHSCSSSLESLLKGLMVNIKEYEGFDLEYFEYGGKKRQPFTFRSPLDSTPSNSATHPGSIMVW
ncbi:hypothetical protein F5B22DRAFT_603262 [Xylaria bambusicola]|uniref:uncharacterized protein n=1 Tax=Xylaria bambusicola TaxID=326684 RepID=UPI002007CEBB|nr:uncharacterized protein F5B22DRAFT_603262 [Xylaria bambusicola]KAI0517515.1 hypothetical protein F5B22DRAFT_603262 [Xylaria bambusicola]